MKKINFENVTKKDLLKEANKIKKELFNLRLNLAAGQVKDYSQFKKMRKEAARALTNLNKKDSRQQDING
ncbi:MAG: 50S ribosomal protein L29 [bacterium]